MVIVITTKERSEQTGAIEIIASHGVDSETNKTVILPCSTPERLGAVFDKELGEYVLPSN